MPKALKFSKDNVKSFIAQERRLKSRLILARNTKRKHTYTENNENLLMDFLGGVNAIMNERTICSGQYNTVVLPTAYCGLLNIKP